MTIQAENLVHIINLQRSRGDTDPIKYRLSDKDTKEAIDITSDTYTLSVSTEEFPTGNTYEFQSTGTIDDGFDGKLSFPIDITAANRFGSFFYDVERVYGGVKKTIIKGTIEFIQDITK